MVTLKKYNLAGTSVGEVTIPQTIAEAEANGQMIKDYIVALRANARQWSANTKGRSEVSHTTKKPHPQKGQGRARQGSLAAPQYKGGGRVFGPKPKFDQHVRINKKEKRAAIRALLADKIREGQVSVVESFHMDAPKTKTLAHLRKMLGYNRRTLFLGEGSFESFAIGEEEFVFQVASDQHHAFQKSLRNLPDANFSLAMNMNGYEVVVAHHLVISEKGLEELIQWLG